MYHIQRCFPRPSQVYTPYDISIGSAVYAQFTVVPRSQSTPRAIFGPILWRHSGPLCHALSLLSSLLLLLWTSNLHCHSPGVATVARHLRYSHSWLLLILVVVSTVATPGEWQCKIRTGGVRRLAVANGPNIFANASCCISSLHLALLGVQAMRYRARKAGKQLSW